MAKTTVEALDKLATEQLAELRTSAERELADVRERQRQLSLRAVAGDEAALRQYHELAARERELSAHLALLAAAAFERERRTQR